MIAYAAIDLRGGEVVQLVGGRPEAERVRIPDAVAVARQWVEAGFRALHVVDLDAALVTSGALRPTEPQIRNANDILSPASPQVRPTVPLHVPSAAPHHAAPTAPPHTPPAASPHSSPTTPAHVPSAAPHHAAPTSSRVHAQRILDAVDVPVQVGGGVRDDAAAAMLFDAGAARVVTGTRAIEDPAWLAALAQRHPGGIVVAADVRGGRVVTRGWRSATDLSVEAVLDGVEALPLAGILVTDVSREGRMGGIDAARFGALVARTRHPLIASGGVAGMDDLRALAATGVAGVVLGMALYTGALDPDAVAAEFAA